jgi:RNA-binding protein Musashi
MIIKFDSDAAVDRACQDHFINLNGKQVEIKKAEPRDGSTNHMMQMDPNQSINASHWGNPMMGNGGPMAMGGPIGMPNPTTAGFGMGNYNYGSSTPNNPSFGWPQQWGSNSYSLPPHQAAAAAQQTAAQGYGAYDYNGPIGYNSTPSSYGAAANSGANWNSWNPNITNLAPNAPGSTSGDMYGRPQSGHNAMHSAPPSGSKPGSEYNGAAAYNGAYTNYYNEQQQQQFSNQNRPRSYGNTEQYPAF